MAGNRPGPAESWPCHPGSHLRGRVTSIVEDLGAAHPPIIVRMEQDRGLATLLESGRGPGIHPCGVINRVCREDALLCDPRDSIARAIHGGGPGALAMGGQALETPIPDVAWEELPEPIQQCRRQAAEHIPHHLAEIGLTIERRTT